MGNGHTRDGAKEANLQTFVAQFLGRALGQL